MRKDQCKFCASRKCYTRIVTPNLGYDEIACQNHIRDLEKHADETLNGGLRCNASSTMAMRRGDPYPSIEERTDAEKEIDRLKLCSNVAWAHGDVEASDYYLRQIFRKSAKELSLREVNSFLFVFATANGYNPLKIPSVTLPGRHYTIGQIVEDMLNITCFVTDETAEQVSKESPYSYETIRQAFSCPPKDGA